MMKTFIIITAAVALALVSSAARAFETDLDAKEYRTDGTVADINAACAAVSEDGWHIVVPGETGTNHVWNQVLSCGPLFNTVFRGASSTSRPSVTALGGAYFAYQWGKTLIIRDLVFEETGRNVTVNINGAGPSPGFRITNCRFNMQQNWPIWIGSTVGTWHGFEGPYGLIDNCEKHGTNQWVGIFANYITGGADGQTWRYPMSFGTEKAVYIEDNLIVAAPGTVNQSGPPIYDSWLGGRVVFRRNTVINGWVGNHGADHDALKQDSGLQYEVMHNTFTFSSSPQNSWYAASWHRGGTGVAFDNDVYVTDGQFVNTGFLWRNMRTEPNCSDNCTQDRWTEALNTTIAAESNGQTLPQSTIRVVSIAALFDFPLGNAFGHARQPDPCTVEPTMSDPRCDQLRRALDLKVNITTSAGVETVTCTGAITGDGSTAAQLTGCTGGGGTMSTGGAVSRPSDFVVTQQSGTGTIMTAIAAGSNNAELPQATIHVETTKHFPQSGTLRINEATTVTYTGKTPTTFTGCTGGVGTLGTAQKVWGIGQDPNHPDKPYGVVEIGHWSNRSHASNGGSIESLSGFRFGGSQSGTFYRDFGSSPKASNTGTWLDTYVESPYPHSLRGAPEPTPTPTPIERAGRVRLHGKTPVLAQP